MVFHRMEGEGAGTVGVAGPDDVGALLAVAFCEAGHTVVGVDLGTVSWEFERGPSEGGLTRPR